MRHLLGTYVPRGVSWMFDSALWRLPHSTGDRRLCLTFDDGPTPWGTYDLLRVLRQHGVQATFFLVGDHVRKHPDAVRAIVSEGHSLGNHTQTHIDAWGVSHQRTLRELSRTTQMIEDVTGQAVRWMRPPYGHLTLPMIRWCRRRAQRMVMWDLIAPDYCPGAAADFIARFTLAHLRAGSIICLHDNRHSTAVTPAALRHCIPQLLADGWSFASLADLEPSLAFKAAA